MWHELKKVVNSSRDLVIGPNAVVGDVDLAQTGGAFYAKAFNTDSGAPLNSYLQASPTWLNSVAHYDRVFAVGVPGDSSDVAGAYIAATSSADLAHYIAVRFWAAYRDASSVAQFADGNPDFTVWVGDNQANGALSADNHLKAAGYALDTFALLIDRQHATFPSILDVSVRPFANGFWVTTSARAFFTDNNQGGAFDAKALVTDYGARLAAPTSFPDLGFTSIIDASDTYAMLIDRQRAALDGRALQGSMNFIPQDAVGRDRGIEFYGPNQYGASDSLPLTGSMTLFYKGTDAGDVYIAYLGNSDADLSNDIEINQIGLLGIQDSANNQNTNDLSTYAKKLVYNYLLGPSPKSALNTQWPVPNSGLNPQQSGNNFLLIPKLNNSSDIKYIICVSESYSLR